MTWEELGAIACSFPGVEASTSYGTAAFKVKKALLTRLKEDGAAVVLFAGSMDEKEMLLAAAPKVFFQTPHYEPYLSLLAHLETLTEAELRPILERTWRAKAPRSLLKVAGA